LTKPNIKFTLNVRDIALIEQALRSVEQTREIQELLGKIHNQKNWYVAKDRFQGGG
jgi:hypothetical protein